MNNEQKTIKNKGFTLPELLTGLTIFSLIIGAASGIFISAIRGQRKSLAYQELLDQTSYLTEYMGRALRMAKKDTGGECIGVDLNYEIIGPGIKFMNYERICQEFYLSGSQLKEDKGGTVSDLTSTALQIVSFNIGPDDSWDQNDDLQPRVTFFLEIKGAGAKPEQQPEIKIQTTISQRNLDIEQ